MSTSEATMSQKNFPAEQQDGIDTPVAPIRKTLWQRAIGAGQDLKNIKPSQVAFMATNIVIGAAVGKLGNAASAYLAGTAATALGLTAATSVGGVLLAGAGIAVATSVGTTVFTHIARKGLSRGAEALAARMGEESRSSNLLRKFASSNGQADQKIFSKAFALKAVTGASISALTFGIVKQDDVMNLVESTKLGKEIVSRVATGTKALSGIFNLQAAKGWLSDIKSHLGIKNNLPAVVKDKCIIDKYGYEIQKATPDEIKLCEDKWKAALASKEVVLEPISAAKAPVVTEVATDAVAQPPESPAKGKGFMGKAKAALKHVAAKVTMPTVTVPVDAHDALKAKEIADVLTVGTQDQLNEIIVRERLSNFIEQTTGVRPADDADLREMAKKMSALNPEATLKALAQQAPQLDKDHVAALCKTAMPKEFGDMTTVNTRCDQYKSAMTPQDVVILRNTNELGSANKGITVIHRTAVETAGEGVHVPSKGDIPTTGFVAGHVPEIVKQMADEAIAKSRMPVAGALTPQ